MSAPAQAYYVVTNKSEIGRWYLAANNWWTRRKDMALKFDSEEKAESAIKDSLWVEKHVEASDDE